LLRDAGRSPLSATVQLWKPETGSYTGAFYAKEIEVFDDTTIVQWPFGCTVP
jgi:hypothetical protein